MKVAIVGAGNVGRTIFHDLQHLNMISEITLIGRNLKAIEAEVMDALDAAILRNEYGPKLNYGSYEDVKDADIIIYTAGSAKLKTDRMELLQENLMIAEEIFSIINQYNKEAIIICVSNPVDLITLKINKLTNRDPHKIIGTGTLLESARLIRFISELLEISDRSINISVIGEHGNSAVALLSSVRIMGLSLDDYLKTVTDNKGNLNIHKLQDAFKNKAYKIVNGKGYTSTGVSAEICKIISAIGRDSREILPVSSLLQGEYGIKDIAISVPSIIGKNGIEEIHEVMMTKEENDAFMESVNKIKMIVKDNNLL